VFSISQALKQKYLNLSPALLVLQLTTMMLPHKWPTYVELFKCFSYL